MTTLLSDAMVQFLSKRPFHKNDAQTAKAIDLKPATVYKWKSDPDPERRAEFLRRYEEVLAVKDKTLAEIDNIVHEELRPAALDRYRELVNMPITEDTPAADKRVIKDAAKDILEKTGDIGGQVDKATAINVFFQQVNVTEDGRKSRPGWNGKTIEQA